MDIYTILVVGHIFGAILGVGGATFIEIHLNMALKDGKMDEGERLVMGYDFLVTRIGMAIGFVTGLGFVLIYYLDDQLWRLNDGVFWAKMAIIVVIIINATLLHKHKIGLYWGSAFSFVSWWGAALLGVFLSNTVKILPGNTALSFIVIMIFYGVCVVVGAWVLHKIRGLTSGMKPPPKKKAT